MTNLPQNLSGPVAARASTPGSSQGQIAPTQPPNVLIGEIYATRSVKDAAGRPTSDLMRSVIPYDEGLALYHWIRQQQVHTSLEIGMAYGLSTLFMCQAHADNNLQGQHIAMDPAQSKVFGNIGLLNIQRAGLEQWLEFYEAPSYAILPKLQEKGTQFDFIFIDGMHTFDYTLVDFFYSDLLLRTGGGLVLDDIWMPSIRKVLTYVVRNRQYCLEPDLFYMRQPFYKRLWQALTQGKNRKHMWGMNGRQWRQNPLDLSIYWTALYFSLKGGLKYWGLRKTGADNRGWDYHVAF